VLIRPAAGNVMSLRKDIHGKIKSPAMSHLKKLKINIFVM